MVRSHSEQQAALAQAAGPFHRALRQVTGQYEDLVRALSILKKIDGVMTPEKSFDQCAGEMLRIISEILFAENVSIYWLDDTGDTLELRAVANHTADTVRVYGQNQWWGHRFKLGEGVIGQVALTGRAFFSNSAAEESSVFLALADSAVSVTSLMAFPLEVGGKIRGVLNLSHSQSDFFSNETERVVSLIADRVARVFANRLRYEQLVSARDDYRRILDQTAVATVVFAKRGAVMHINPAATRMTGRTAPELLDREDAWVSQIAPEDRTRFLEHLQNVWQNKGENKLEYAFINGRSDKRFFEQESKLMRTAQNYPAGVVCVIRDVTHCRVGEAVVQERRNFLEREVEKNRTELVQANYELRRFAAIINQLQECVALCNSQGLIQYTNPAFQETLGYVGQDLTNGDFQFLNTDRPEQNLSSRLHACCREDSSWSGLITVRAGDGHLLQMEGRIFPLEKTQTEGRQFVVLLRDITARQDLEKQFQQTQKMRTIGTLANGIAHDFNNILFANMGYTRIALKQAAGNAPLEENLGEILIGQKRAAGLVDQILAFSRQVEDIHKPVHLVEVLHETIQLLQVTLPENVKLENRSEIERDTVLGVASQIQQVILNICTNALQAVKDQPNGRIEISLAEIHAPEECIDRSEGLKDGAYVRISIHDNGPGLDPETLRRVFEPFFTTRAEQGNVGLGLSSAMGIVQNHHGAIHAYSEKGYGATFNVLLPLSTQLPKKALPPKALQNEDLQGSERILVVDDEEQVLRMLRITLQRFGYSIEAFSSSREALETFCADPESFDLIIADQAMPEMTGLELMKHVLSIRPDTPVILITGYSEAVDNKTALDAGARGFAMKPVIMDDLIRKARDILNQPSPSPQLPQADTNL